MKRAGKAGERAARQSGLIKGELRRFAATLAGLARWKLLGAVALMVLFSLSEGAGIALILPTLQAAGLDMSRQGEAGNYARMVARAIAAAGLPPTLPTMLGILVLIVSARAIVNGAQTVASFSVDQAMALGLRRRLYTAIADADWLFIARSRASDFAHAMTAELGRVELAAWHLMKLASEAALVLLYVLLAFKLSPPMTGLVLCFGALVALLLRGRTRSLHQGGGLVSDASNRLHAVAIEHLQNLKTIKTYGAQRRSIGVFSALNERLLGQAIGVVREQAALTAWFEIGSVSALGLMIYLSIRLVAVPAAELLILILLFSRLMPKLTAVHRSYQTFVSLLPAFANVISLEQRCVAAAEPPGSPGEPLVMREAVRLEQVWFAYRPGQPVIRGLKLEIPAGQVTAIVGPSGSGKSTIADLIMGLIAPCEGQVTIDGAALAPARARAWRERIGYVGQDSFLFHDTVRANLAWADPAAGQSAMLNALRAAAAEEFVRALPQGLETVVGDRGVMLSNGQRQRLALARAMLRRPAMLVLDEATNSLDSENESKVLGAIEGLRGRVTTLLIAHRMSTIRWADLIYVIEDGRVVESGNWDTLNSRHDSRFRELCEAQNVIA